MSSSWDSGGDEEPFRLRDIPLLLVGLAMAAGLVAFWGYAAWTYVTGFLGG